MPISIGDSVGLVLAAGFSSRFGSTDKLLRPLRGAPLAAHIARTLGGLGLRRLIAVCPADVPDRPAIFEEEGFEVLDNPEPGRGMGHSLALGARRAMELEAAALLVCLADMPNVTAAHLRELFRKGIAGGAVATESAGARSPPALFDAALLPALAALDGDAGARHLLRDADTVAATAELVRDYDRPADFDI